MRRLTRAYPYTDAPARPEYDDVSAIPIPFILAPRAGMWKFVEYGDDSVERAMRMTTLEPVHKEPVRLQRRAMVAAAFRGMGVQHTYEEMDVVDRADVQCRMPGVDAFLEQLGAHNPLTLPRGETAMISVCGVPFGAGKTRLCSQLADKFVKAKMRVVYVVPRARLADQIMTRVGGDICHYATARELKKKSQAEFEAYIQRPVVVTTVHSLHLVTRPSSAAFGLVIIDEAVTLDEDMTADYTRNQSHQMLRRLCDVVWSAKCTVVVDADEDPFVTFFAMPSLYDCSGRDYTVHFKRVINSERARVLAERPRRPIERRTKADTLEAVYAAVDRGEKVAIFFSSKREMAQLHEELSQKHQRKVIRSVSSDTAARVQTTNLAEWCSPVDVLMFTTCWAVGMDIDMSAEKARQRDQWRTDVFISHPASAYGPPGESWVQFTERLVERGIVGEDDDMFHRLLDMEEMTHHFSTMFAFFSPIMPHRQQLQAINRVRQYDKLVFSVEETKLPAERRMWLKQLAPPSLPATTTIRERCVELLREDSNKGTVFSWETVRQFDRTAGEDFSVDASAMRAVASALRRDFTRFNTVGLLLEGLAMMHFDVSGCFKATGSWAKVPENPLSFYQVGFDAACDGSYHHQLEKNFEVSDLVATHGPAKSRLRFDAFVVGYGMGRLEEIFHTFHALEALRCHDDHAKCYPAGDQTDIVARADTLKNLRRSLLYCLLEAYFPDAVEAILFFDDPAREDYVPVMGRQPSVEEIASLRAAAKGCLEKTYRIADKAVGDPRACYRLLTRVINEVLGFEWMAPDNKSDGEVTYKIFKNSDLPRLVALYRRWAVKNPCEEGDRHRARGVADDDLWATVCEYDLGTPYTDFEDAIVDKHETALLGESRALQRAKRV